MTKYVALLRGIGPINQNMRSEKLKAFFEGLGFNNVQTVITSGNLIFDSNSNDVASMEARIEKALPLELGFNSSTIIRSQAELKSLIDQDPYHGQDHNQKTYLLVTFFKQKPHVPFELPYQPDNKPYKIIGRGSNTVYGTVDLTTGKTPDYMVWLERQFGKDITSRTWKTIQRILDKMNQT